MSEVISSNKRIAKNTLMLYIRMLLLMLVNLYTSRVVFNVLGVEDYGLYSVVGSIVIFLGFVNASMTAASQRFLSYSKGHGDLASQTSMFNSLSVTHIITALLIFVIAEPGGIFYIETYLNVAPEKISAAHIVFQFSLFSLLIKTTTVPYNAAIIANERMSAFAYISIGEVALQLSSALILKHILHNQLIWYAVMMFLTVLCTQIGYVLYSKIHFKECRSCRTWDKKTVKEVFSYSGWNLLGTFSSVTIDQGVNMLLNSFFGVIVNASRGIAFQVSGAITTLSGNFQQAMNPQIVKSYASNDLSNMHRLIIKGTRFSFYLLLIFSAPIFFNITQVLSIWLNAVPEYATTFCRLILINALISACSGPLLTGAMATGHIKKYQIIVASINLLNLPISWIGLKLLPNPYLTVYVMILLSIIAFIARLLLVSQMIKLPKRLFLTDAILRMGFVSVVSGGGLWLIYNNMGPSESLGGLIFRLFVSFLFVISIISLIGISKQERNSIIQTIKSRIPGI